VQNCVNISLPFVPTMAKLFVLFAVLFALLFTSCVVADDDVAKVALDVMFTMNNYVIDLNRLVEYGTPPARDNATKCNASAVDNVGLQNAANILVEKYFSKNVRQYLVVQDTATTPQQVVLNFTVDPAGPFPDSTALFNTLKGFYGLFPKFFSPPFYWLLSAPLITDYQKKNADWNDKSTVQFLANNENKGFMCADGVNRIYRVQESEYQHLLVLEDGSWKFAKFIEVNKNMVTYDVNIVTQLQPQFYN